MRKNFVGVGAVLVAVLALTGCTKAEGLTELAEAEYRLACAQAGGDLQVRDNPVTTLQCIFTFPDLPKAQENQQ